MASLLRVSLDLAGFDPSSAEASPRVSWKHSGSIKIGSSHLNAGRMSGARMIVRGSFELNNWSVPDGIACLYYSEQGPIDGPRLCRQTGVEEEKISQRRKQDCKKRRRKKGSEVAEASSPYWEKPNATRKACQEASRLTRELKEIERYVLEKEEDQGLDPFQELQNRFKAFKKKNYVENLDHYQNLSQNQSPKFMVIACADSRVCPSNILGFQSGEAFTVRNVANLVPPFEHGGSETSAALEFAVNSLQVPNILVVGHSRCGGIQALMSMKDSTDSRSFIKDWVSIGRSARLSTKAAAGNLSFEQQCRHCEKESINGSLLNLLTYPWIEQRVTDGTLSLHGGYYDFVTCTFEKWTLVYRQGLEGGSKYAITNRTLWA